MKIAVLYMGRRGAGGPISLALGCALAQQGAEVAAWLSTGLESLAQWQGATFPVHTVSTFENALSAAWSLVLPRRIRSLAEEVRAWRPDALLFPMAHPWNAALQRALAPIPAIVMVHDPRPHPDLAGRIFARFEDASLRQAAACLVLSQALQPDLERRWVPAAKIAIVPHGPLEFPVETHDYSSRSPGRESRLPVETQDIASRPPGREPGRPAETHNHASLPGAPTLLFLGRITPYKGLDVLLAACERLNRARPELRLCIAGEGSLAPYRPALMRLPDVEIINRWLSDAEIRTLFQKATILVLPYTSASQSGVLAAAAPFALPVIATRAGGLPEQIESGVTGLLVTPGSADELVTAIERLLGEPEYAERLGEALKRDFAKNRGWGKAASVIFELVREFSQA